MEYLQHHLSLSEQAEILLSYGLEADSSLLVARLKDVGYCRLKAYFHPFLQRDENEQPTKTFIPKTTLEKVWSQYLFDRRLRFLLLDAIERIEVALRSHIAHHHTKNQSPFAYANESYFPHRKGYIQSLERVRLHQNKQGNIIQSGNDIVDRFFATYGNNHKYLPLWLAVGEMEFGTIVYFYTHSEKSIRKAIAAEWGTDTGTLFTWLTSLRVLRNDCAHHARIWNKKFQTQPKMQSSATFPWDYVYSNAASKWVKPTKNLAGAFSLLHASDSLAPLLYICRHLLKQVAPTSHWHTRMQDFLLHAESQGIPLHKMGLPNHWEQHPLWR